MRLSGLGSACCKLIRHARGHREPPRKHVHRWLSQSPSRTGRKPPPLLDRVLWSGFAIAGSFVVLHGLKEIYDEESVGSWKVTEGKIISVMMEEVKTGIFVTEHRCNWEVKYVFSDLLGTSYEGELRFIASSQGTLSLECRL